MVSRVVHVAVGVIVGRRGASIEGNSASAEVQGAILIAKRSANTHQGGLWEFPGGKVECGETVFNALKRELQEELAIEVVATEPLIKIRHDYGDKVVLLDVHKVTQFLGAARGNEGQPIQWVAPLALHEYEFPAANRPIVTAINLPPRLLITGYFSEPSDFLARIESALQKGIRMVQLRVQTGDVLKTLLGSVTAMCDCYSAQLMINTSPQVFAELVVGECAAGSKVGLHLNSSQLLRCNVRPVGCPILLGASCHTESEIKHAEKIGVDYICLSPVQPTRSHPNQAGLGWEKFRILVENTAVPVYALGGMTELDLEIAAKKGAQGIASISAWW